MSTHALLRGWAIGAAALAIMWAAPAAAQGAGARVTASVTVVERVGAETGRTTVAADRAGHLDVTTPLAIQGRAAAVVHAVRGDPADATRPPLEAVVRRPSDADGELTARLRLPGAPRAAAGEAKASVTYVISTIN